MSDNISSNTRIAKNSLALFLRMILTLCISLYTSRVILQTLGVEDYGIYNVVGGVVSMLAFVNSTLTASSSRFITFALGTNDKNELQSTFNSIITIHYLFAVFLFLLAETIGLWFVLNKLTIPEERVIAAVWVYQSAVLSSVIMFVSAPYNALIVAHEKMTTFAYVSIIDKLAQLGIVYILLLVTKDRLIVYAVLMVIVQLLIRLIYTLYCRHNFEESYYHLCLDKKRLKTIFSYAGWILSGNVAFLGYTQGLNILLNIYFGPVVNAARGLSVQVQGSILQFTNSFQTAINPQIIKSYARNELQRMHQLVLASSRLGFYLMLLIVLPLFLKIDYVLNLWLTEVPEHTSSFVRIMLIVGLNSTWRNPTITAIQATGDVKKFQLWEASLLLTILPTAWFLLKYFVVIPEVVILVYLFVELFVQFVRIWIVYKKIELPRSKYITKVIIPCISVLLVASCISYKLSTVYNVDTFYKLIIFVMMTTVIVLLPVYAIGLTRNERRLVKQYSTRFLKKVFA